MKKKSNNTNGSLCSGYGVFPDGSACKGCMDCGGKPPKTIAGLKKVFDRNHTTLTVGKNFDLEKELSKFGKEVTKTKHSKIKAK